MPTKAYHLLVPLAFIAASIVPGSVVLASEALERSSTQAEPSAGTAPHPGGTDMVRQLVAAAAAETGIPAELADAIVQIESRYNPKARSRGHFGLTQISLPAARSLGYSGGSAGLLEPRTNLHFGLRYLAEAYRLAGGDTCGTVLRYQAGHRATVMTGAARRYCARVQTLTLTAALY